MGKGNSFIQRVVGGRLACGHVVPAQQHASNVVVLYQRCGQCLMAHFAREVVAARLARGRSVDTDSVANEVAQKLLAAMGRR